MGDTVELKNAYNWSVSQLSRAFEFDRATVRKRLQQAGVQPVAKDGAATLYKLSDAAQALYSDAGNPGEQDPSKMTPQDRRAWYQSETERLNLEREQGHLVLDDEVAREYSVLVKAMVGNLDTLPDELERDYELPAEALEYIQKRIDALREQMYLEASE